MRATGVVRRIDELGRVVIPKDIRKSLRLLEGDNLEIYVEDEYITLKRFSSLKDISSIAQYICDSIYNVIGKDIVVCDNNEVVAVSSSFTKELLNKRISNNLLEYIKRKKDIDTNIPIIENDKSNYNFTSEYIISNGDILGLVIIIDDLIDENDMNIAKILGNFFGKYIENWYLL